MASPGHLILAYHGCDQTTKELVLSGKGRLKPSTNSYDWLGHGIYFWDSDPVRALEFAQESKARKGSSIKDPAVIGAVLNLGSCMDLLQRAHIKQLQTGYEQLKIALNLKSETIPENKKPHKKTEFLLRYLDCAVINYVHDMMKANGTEYDSVRAAFWEGDAIFENSGFRAFNHIQICVRSYSCIQGYFVPAT